MVSRRTFLKIASALPVMALFPERAFASEKSSNAPVSISQASENEFTITDADGTWTITIAETEDSRQVNLVSPSGETEYLFLDKREKTLYSSITGEIVDASDAELEGGGSDQPQPYGLGTVYPIRRSQPTYYYRNYSYAKLKAAAGATSTITSIASVIMTFTGVGGESLQAIIDTISTLTGIVGNIKKGSKSHGIRVKLRKARVYEYHDFQQKWIEINPEITIAGVSTY